MYACGAPVETLVTGGTADTACYATVPDISDLLQLSQWMLIEVGSTVITAAQKTRFRSRLIGHPSSVSSPMARRPGPVIISPNVNATLLDERRSRSEAIQS